MKNKNNETKSNDNVIHILLTIDLKTIKQDEAIELLEHLKNQFRNRYRYLVGEWSNAHRAKDTRTGIFVTNQEVINYLQ